MDQLGGRSSQAGRSVGKVEGRNGWAGRSVGRAERSSKLDDRTYRSAGQAKQLAKRERIKNSDARISCIMKKIVEKTGKKADG